MSDTQVAAYEKGRSIKNGRSSAAVRRKRMLPDDWEIEIEKSRRKTLSVSVRQDGSILVKAPMRLPKAEIYRFLQENQDWILDRMERMAEIRKEIGVEGELTPEELRSLSEMAKRVIPPKVAFYAEILGVTYGRITIRNQRSRWGSCSSAGNLNFNCLLMLAPGDVIDYVVVHELCHRLEMNHSARFWAHVAEILPGYRVQRKWLRDNGEVLMRRVKI